MIPLRVFATDLDTGEEVVFARGPLKPALLASTALPGCSRRPPRRPPLVDGAVVDNVPLWHALAGPVDRVYVLNVSGDLIAARCAHRSTSRCAPSPSPQPALRARAAQRARDLEVFVLPAPVDDRELFDFSGARKLIDDAHGLAELALDEADAASAAAAPSAVRGGAATPRSSDR